MSESATWKNCTIRDVIERHFCGPSPDCEERKIFGAEEWGVLKTTAVTWAGWDETAHKVLPRAFWGQPQIEVHAGDVLVTKAGPRNRVGVVCHVPSTRSQLVVSGKMIGLRPKPEVVNARFLAGFLTTKEPQKYIHDRTTGMAESQVNFANEVLLDSPLRLPPVNEQHLIAKVLDTLDTAIRETEALIDKLKAVKQGLLHDLLTRGIDANGKMRPPQSEAPQLYKESQLGWIPREWNQTSTRELCSLITKGTTPAANNMWQGGEGIRFLRVDNLSFDGQFDFVASNFRVSLGTHRGELSRSICLPGDVLTNIVGPPLGKLGLVTTQTGEVNINQAIALFRPKPSLLPSFALLWLGSTPAQTWLHKRAKQTSGQVNLTLALCQELPIPAVSLEEQHLIVESIEEMHERLSMEGNELIKLQHMKSGLMDDLLTGRVRVTPLLEGGATP